MKKGSFGEVGVFVIVGFVVVVILVGLVVSLDFCFFFGGGRGNKIHLPLQWLNFQRTSTDIQLALQGAIQVGKH